MTKRPRIVATVLVLVGLVATAASVDVTRASWNDEATFGAGVSSGQWETTTTSTTTTSTTTTVPSPPPPANANGGISAGNADTVISGITWSLSGSRQFCAEVRITGRTSTARPWQINVDLTQAPFYGVSPSGVQTNSTGVITTVSTQSLRITGNGPFTWQWDPRQNNTPVTNSQTALLTICVYNAPVPPPAAPSTYTVTYANGTWTTTEACVVATITTTRHDLASFPFSYGWSIPIDLTAAKAKITSVGNTLNYVGWTPYPNGPTDGTATPSTFSPPLDSYTFTSGFDNALRAAGGGADSRTVTACVFGFTTGKNGKGPHSVAETVNVDSTPSLARVPEATTTPESTTTTLGPDASSTTSAIPTTTTAPSTIPVTTGPAAIEPAAPASTAAPTSTPAASTTVAATTPTSVVGATE